MKLGIVDLGTNSLRFDIYELSKRKRPKLLYHEKDMIRLGEDVFTKKKLSPKAMQKTLKRLKIIQKIVKKYKVDHMLCQGTSPLREAKDARQFLQKIQKETGLAGPSRPGSRAGFKFKVLSGQKEANLIALAMNHFHKTPKKTLFIDIGGGSTEISLSNHGKISFSKSVPLGSMRLQQQFLKKIPPTAKAIENLRHHIQKILKQNFSKIQDHPQKAMGSAGTIKALEKVAGHGSKYITRLDLEKFLRKIKTLKLPKLRNLLKTEGKRGDILLAGTLLLLEIMRFFHLKSILVTKKGLRDGVLLAFTQKYVTKNT